MKPPKMNTRALKTLIHDLRVTVPKLKKEKNFKFEMGSWFDSEKLWQDIEYKERLKELDKLAKKGNICGTSACAAGTYALLHPNSELKLKLCTDIYGDSIIQPAFKRVRGTNACAKYFGLTQFEAEYIFEFSNNSEKMVADRIEKVMAKRKKFKTKEQIDDHYIWG